MTGYDVAGLAAALRRDLAGRVHDDAGALAMYATDASNYRVVPDLVVLPEGRDDLTAALAHARHYGAPVAMRGGGTSMAGNAIGGVVVDVSALNAILDLDPVARTATVQPGVVLTDLIAAARPHGLTFGADPSSASRATLGGMIANNACGAHSVAWGTTADNLRGLEVITGAGHHLDLRTPDHPAAAVGDSSSAVAGHGRRTPTGGGWEGSDTRGSVIGGSGFGAADLGGPGGADAGARLLEELAGIGERHATLIERRFGTFSRQISGYAAQHLLPGAFDPARLLCGSEGTLATTLSATVNLVQLPPVRALLVLGFTDTASAADAVGHILPHGPLTMESINATLVDRLPDDVRRRARAAGLPPGYMWLLVEVGAASAEEAGASAARIAEATQDAIAGATSAVVTDAAAQAVLWRCRRDGTGLATRRADGAEAWAGWEDAAVPPHRLGQYLRGLDELMGRYGYSGASYGHFGEGCMHMRIDFDLFTAAGVSQYRGFLEQATDLVVGLGGSVSGEHGDGRARSEMVRRMYGADSYQVFEEVKAAWDPEGTLNPHVIVDPLPVDQDLRHRGPAKDRMVATLFSYPSDGGSFATAQRRCVGVGKCRQSSGGVMCPSFQVTGEEEHSTRGRAHLLWEMMQGEVITDGWRSTEVRDALDLCLSCKGCLGDCPVNVDIATYKAEFTHHHYAGRPWARPRSHWSMGWLPALARFGAATPGLVNAVTSSPAAPALKWLGGIAAERDIPRFATQTFTSWFAKRTPSVAGAVAIPGPRSDTSDASTSLDGGSAAGAASLSGAGSVHASSSGADAVSASSTDYGASRRVVIWPDTFTNYLAPEVGKAAVAVLEDAGFVPELPDGAVCCGLTWISTGQLKQAGRVLRRSMKVLEPALRAGVPVVGLEPSCTAALRHDAADLLGGDEVATLAKEQVFTLAEFLAERAPEWTPPRVGGSALAQVHCHQHSVLGFDADSALMRAAGIEVEVPDSGCCGLAGNFGFERGHYEISQAVGERVLLPKVREAPPETAVIADGFSCRTQIEQGTTRRARHLAEILADALP